MASSTKKVIDDIIEFVEVKTEQIKLKIITRVSRMLSGVIALSMLTLFSMFFLFFLSFAFAEMINSSLESTYLGYLLISGGYFLIILTVVLLLNRSCCNIGLLDFQCHRMTRKKSRKRGRSETENPKEKECKSGSNVLL